MGKYLRFVYKIKDTTVPNLKSENINSIDASYRFAFNKLKGKVSAFYTGFNDQTEISSFYHDAKIGRAHV